MTVNAYADIVEQIATIHEDTLSHDGLDDETRDYARRLNQQGWTVETPGGLGSTLRTEGVYLDPETLERAIAEGMQRCLDRLTQA